ncbi:MAG TPA: CBS domain-containing protein, partial [Nevskiaceae bacterium]|nr:CBS domain-containing protein [Nevskiaceae bacterium]
MSRLDTITAKDYMSSELLTFTPDMELMTAINLLAKRRISGAPVLDGAGKVIGILSEKDCLKVCLAAGYEGVPGGLVREYMSSKVVTVEADASLLEVAGLFVNSPYKRLPVMKDGKLAGQISRSDVLR